MSSIKKITKHPQSGNYEIAFWIDDYFGPHIYGVSFPSDEKVYPTALVESKQIYNFWADDVLGAFREFLYGADPVWDDTMTIDELELLNLIQKHYDKRWHDDPETGNGATMDGVE